jgi:hypothetical protein
MTTRPVDPVRVAWEALHKTPLPESIKRHTSVADDGGKVPAPKPGRPPGPRR